MEEILASIRRIIADEDTGKAKPVAAVPPPPKPEPVPPPVAAKPVPPPAPPPKPPETTNNQADIDAMLASVEVAPVVKAPPPPPKPVAPPVADVLDLTEAMAAAPPPPSPSFRTIDAASDIVFAEGNAEPLPEPPRAPPSPPPMLDRGLMSSATQAAVDHAFSSLAGTVLGNNARTLEDLVKEMLRPMLKGWLDDNLPGLVERIVRAEIERVSRGGR